MLINNFTRYFIYDILNIKENIFFDILLIILCISYVYKRYYELEEYFQNQQYQLTSISLFFLTMLSTSLQNIAHDYSISIFC